MDRIKIYNNSDLRGAKKGINQNLYKKQWINNMIMYIAFSSKTHKLYAKILCKKFRHCAPVLCLKNKCVMYQFICPRKIVPISLTYRDINILKTYGWVFIKYKKTNIINDIINSNSLTCVQFTKLVCGIKNKSIQTPDALFNHLMKQ